MTYWSYNFFNYFKHKNNLLRCDIHLLPTINLWIDNIFDKNGAPEDCSFNITFQWLWFGLTIFRYWGSNYNWENQYDYS